MAAVESAVPTTAELSETEAATAASSVLIATAPTSGKRASASGYSSLSNEKDEAKSRGATGSGGAETKNATTWFATGAADGDPSERSKADREI
jgi:hypothetical protein